MSSYPIVLKDEFLKIISSCPLTLTAFDSVLISGSMKAGKDLADKQMYGKSRFRQDTKTEHIPATRCMASRLRTVGINQSYYRPVPRPGFSTSWPREGAHTCS
jgi:hypothetical protein